MALQKRPRFRNVDMRRFPKFLGELGPDYLTEEDYLNVGGPEASAFYREYGKDPLISDLLNRYSFARFGLGDDESLVSTLDRDDPRFKEGPIREYIPGVIDYDLPDVTGIPVTSIQKLRDQLEMGVEGQGDGAPIEVSGEDNDPSIGYEKALERFKSQARKDLVNFKDFLGEEVSEEERKFAFKPEEVDYEDFTPIRDRSSIEYEPSEPLGYVAPIFDENFLPMELPESNFTPVDPNKNLEYTPLEELLNSKAKGGLVGLPIIARSNGGSSNSSSNQNTTDDNNYDVEETGGYRGDQTGPSMQEAEDQYKQDLDQRQFDLEDDFAASLFNKFQESDLDIENRLAELDPTDIELAKDLQRQAITQGLDVEVGYDPETQTPSYTGGMDAFTFGLSQIGQGLGDLGKLSSDFYTGLTSLTPQGIIRDILIGDPKLPGGALRTNLLDREQPFFDSTFAKGITKTILGDATASIDLREAFKNLTTKQQEEVEEKVKKGKSTKQAIEEVFNKINLEGGFRVVDNPITGGALTMDTRDSAFPEEIEY